MFCYSILYNLDNYSILYNLGTQKVASDMAWVGEWQTKYLFEAFANDNEDTHTPVEGSRLIL